MSFRNPPPRPAPGDAGFTGEVLFMQAVWDYLFDPRVNIFCDHPILKFSKTARGYVPRLRASGGGSAPGSTNLFKITDAFATKQDFFTAQQILADGSYDPATVYIAKHPKDRPSVTAVNISGSAVTYTYTANFTRTTTIGGNSQNEQLFLIPQTNDIIYCSRLPFPDPLIATAQCTWVDITPRVWAKVS